MKPAPDKSTWTPQQSAEYYGLPRWGQGHFCADDDGFVCVRPLGEDGPSIRIADVLAEAEAEHGLRPPLTIRVQDLLRRRVEMLNEAFRRAIEQEAYAGNYRGVFPIKVNQLREVVEEILDAGRAYDFGLEAGSKPELLIALSQLDRKGDLLICNGYKDMDYIRAALLGVRLGREVILVIEQFSEVDAIIKVTREMGVEPNIGFRVKLSAPGEGKWATSTGDNAKFGLTAAEIVAAAKKLKRAKMGHCLKLVHFHIGSQVPNILTIKKAVSEAARFYCEICKMGFALKYLDVGGGLGIDYDGSRTNFESSMNYSMGEYARDIVFNIKNVCEQAEIPVPDIISESGRALVAPHSILVIEAVDRIVKIPEEADKLTTKKKPHPLLADLIYILENRDNHGALERFHDAQQKKEEAANLFSLGYLDLATRAKADTLFWQICAKIQASLKAEGYVPEDLENLGALLAEQYVCNFSVFQSLLDHWALDQLFPIAPLQRLGEEPTIEATLVDITCDSDGKVSEFVDLEDVRHSLRLHPLGKDPYFLGIFLVGAYQDIMGDLHNLFGRVNEVHVFLEEDEEDGFYIEETIRGFSTDEVLNFIQHKGADLTRAMKKQIDTATRNDIVKPREGVRLLNLYTDMLAQKTYLRPGDNSKPIKKKSGG
ncbi:biosynthetic arginine decarboxylase [Cerasicoccus arenae]|uniref:Arginine decarboxylase n=1 Tax=Cerasicoccus arenae TaxID=424488 RepID=A0A8J3D6S1_9BACT|nr:biosynthetic arginine decarboxylase [Cerasicoccus arenae]MBK1858308.1 biosynthetic arginine decarboxylase [Cerasicoccus arenae]GHB90675.1 biosynthetic arginine decarboxylase [Cerasicoccus arenae]